jgi:hypothetical protein
MSYSRLLIICSLFNSGCATDAVVTQTRPHYVEPKHPEDFRAVGETVPGNPAYNALLPFAVLFDVATSPIQAVAILVIGLPTAPKPTKKNP